MCLAKTDITPSIDKNQHQQDLAIVSLTTVISFQKIINNKILNRLLDFSALIVNWLVWRCSLWPSVGYQTEFLIGKNPKISVSSLADAKWGPVPGDISGQLPYYFQAYFTQLWFLLYIKFFCTPQINKVVRKNLITVLSKSFLVHQSWIVFLAFTTTEEKISEKKGFCDKRKEQIYFCKSY